MFGIDDMAIAALGSAAIGGLASWWGQDDANKANRDIARETNMFSAQQAQMNRDFQERMSNTQWQRGVADMKAAGINPMLLASKGIGGASSPSGSSATGQSIPMQSKTQAAVNSAMQASMIAANLENIRSQTAKSQSDAALNSQLIKTSQTQAELNASNARVAEANARVGNANAANVATQLPGLLKEQKIDETKFGTIMRYLGRLNPFGHSAASVIKAVK